MSLQKKIAGFIFDFIDKRRGMNEYVALPKKVKKSFLEVREWVKQEAQPMVDKIDAAPHDEVNLKWEILKKGAKINLLTMMLPGIYGGKSSMLDLLRYGSLTFLPFVEELSACSPGIATLFGAHYLGIMPIQFCMDVLLGRRLLKPIVEAERAGNPKLVAFAITEPGAGSDVEDTEGGEKAHLGTFAKKVSGGYVLNGRKQFISDGNMASLVTVFACLDREKGIHSWTCFAVTSDMKGFSVGRVEDKMGQRASPAAELIFEDVFIPDKNLVGRENDGWRLNTLTLDTSRGPVGGIAIGAAKAALKQAIEFAEEKGLINDRSIQLELADMIGRFESARSLLWRSCGTFPPLEYLSAIAKFTASDTAMDICSRTIDLMGEEGGLRRRTVERLYRDVKLTQIYEGTNQINRLAVAEDYIIKKKREIL
ncbi:MAG TPA: acyl-CoA dehydrogenase family protein [bacterium]